MNMEISTIEQPCEIPPLDIPRSLPISAIGYNVKYRLKSYDKFTKNVIYKDVSGFSSDLHVIEKDLSNIMTGRYHFVLQEDICNYIVRMFCKYV
jgi:hypothetical protein